MEYRSSSARAPSGIPVGLLFAIGFVILAGVSAGREWYRQNRVQGEVQALEAQVTDLEKRKQAVAHVLEKLQSPEVLDREARLRLHMQRPGERVYILRGETWQQATESATLPTLYEAKEPVVVRSNPERWFQFFFLPSTS
jgi:cell division protein FtsB